LKETFVTAGDFAAAKKTGAKTHGFEETISNSDQQILDDLLTWARSQKDAVRALFCAAFFHTKAESLSNFILEQFDKGLRDAIFPTYVLLKYRRNKTTRFAVPYSQHRMSILLRDLERRRTSESVWSVALLSTLAMLDVEWAGAIGRAAKSSRSRRLREILRLLSPSASARQKTNFVRRLVNAAPSISSLDEAVLKSLSESPLALSEEFVLTALKKKGRAMLKILDVLIDTFAEKNIRISKRRVDEWIDVIAALFPEPKWEMGDSWDIASFLSAELLVLGRGRVLSRVNDVNDQARDFLLTNVVPRMGTITTDDLNAAACERLLEVYLNTDDAGYFGSSPGKIATEEFIVDKILPRANVTRGARRRRCIQTILEDAGRRHDRRYWAPWMVPSTG
jgi:hypothetical protein